MFTIKNTSCVFRNLKQVHLAVHNTTGNGLIAVLGLGLPGLPKPSFVKVLGAPEPHIDIDIDILPNPFISMSIFFRMALSISIWGST